MAVIGGVDLGRLTDFLFFFQNGSVDANWQGATKGFVGDVAVNGLIADERTSGGVPYAGTIYTNDNTLSAWESIIAQNPGQASASYNQVSLINELEGDLISAIQQINGLSANPGSLPAPYNVNFNGTIQSLDGLNTQNGINEVFVLNITSGFQVSSQIDITGDAGDVFILRWDTDANFADGYEGQVKFQSGGAIVPHGGLKPTNFISVAGDINSSGGGSTPPPPYPQGPRYNDGQGALINGGQDFSGGGYFTGYWLTTGAPTDPGPGGLKVGKTSSLSNGIFVGGWYTLTTQFSMTSGTSGVYVSPPTTFAQPSIDVEKEVWDGTKWVDADTAPGPTLVPPNPAQFRFTVTNTSTVTLTNVQVTDDNPFQIIGTVPTLAPGASQQWTISKPWALGPNTDNATATGTGPNNQTVTDTDPAHYIGSTASIQLVKEVYDGTQWVDANTATGPIIPKDTIVPFRWTVTNNGLVNLTDITVTDDPYGAVGTLPSLAVGASFSWTYNETWAAGQQYDLGTATAKDPSGQTVTDTDPAYYFGAEPSIGILKEVSPDNGVTWFDANDPPGPVILPGITPQFRFTVTNTSLVTLTDVQVTDDNPYQVIGTIPSLAPGGSQQWIITKPWTFGPNTDTATATGTGPNNQTVTATDPAHYLGSTAAIDVEKYVWDGTQWVDADTPTGPYLASGTNPQFKFVVTNTGLETLTDVVVTDNNPYQVIGTIPSLAGGASQEWIITGTWAAGQHADTATATGYFGDQAFTDTDPAHYFGSSPAIDVEKEVWDGTQWVDADNPPGPSLASGTNPQFRFTVTNTGNVTLQNVQVTDDNPYQVIGTIPSLAPGGSQQWTITGTWAAGQHVDTATATGTDPTGKSVTDTDKAHYYGVPGPAIDVEKEVWDGTQWVDADTPTGPILASGTNPLFRFTVRNTGNVTLQNVQVTDDNPYQVIGTIPSLAPGGSQQWTITGTWAAGQHVDTATAIGYYNNQPITDTDPAHYFGASPAIDVEKEIWDGTQWVDADNPPGPSLVSGTNPQFRFTVTNTGNVPLQNVTVTDDNPYQVIGTIPSLAPGGSQQWTITGTWAAGQHVDTATATGTDPTGKSVTDTDKAHYYGMPGPAIDVEKEVWDGTQWVDADTPTGPILASGTNPQFRFTVTNIGNVTLQNVQVTDDNPYQVIGTIPSLAPGGSQQWTITGTWAAGQHVDTATAIGYYNGQPVTDSDKAHYLGAPIPRPAIDIEKYVWDGTQWVDADTPTGPNIPQGTAPQFKIVVTNIGNVTLTNVLVKDNSLNLSTTIPSLAPGASQTFFVTGTWAPGQQVNTATASTTYNGQPVTDSDQAHYFGTIVPTPGITVKKLVSPDGGKTFVDAETAPGPVIPQGTNPIFRFIVTNTGNVALTNITLTDTVFGPITVPSTLAPGLSFTVEKTGVWSPCEHMNVATVTGKYGTATVTDSDQAHYVGLPNPTMFKQFSIEENVSIPNQKPTAEDILDANVSVVITDVHPIKTPKGTSYEGQIMTGWKLIVEGRLVQNVVYIANDYSQSVHAAEFEVPFSTFIILPEDFKQCTPLHVEGFVEDVFVKLIDGRRIFKNITLRIEAKSKC